MPSHSTVRALVRAVAYLRASGDDQQGSCPRQRAVIERWALEHGYVIVRWYVDDAIAGDDLTFRPQFEQMTRDITERGNSDAVVVLTLNRFARMDPADFFAAAKPFI